MLEHMILDWMSQEWMRLEWMILEWMILEWMSQEWSPLQCEDGLLHFQCCGLPAPTPVPVLWRRIFRKDGLTSLPQT